MKVTQEKLPNSQVGLEIEIPGERSQKAYEQVVGKFMRSAQIPGFRKGKVPRQVILQRFGSEKIKAAAVEELIEDSLKEAVSQAEIQAIGNFQLRSAFDDLVTQYQPGEALRFSASVDVPPEVKLGQYTDLNVKAAETRYDPTQVETLLQAQQSERATLIPVEGRPAQRGDVALVDFAGRLVPEDGSDEVGEEIPGGQAQDFQIELSEGQFIEGFVEGILGMTVDEIKEIPVVFPQGYPQEELAGRAATFTVTLKEIKEKELPPLDDDFAQEASEYSTLAELRSFLETRYQDEAKQKTETSIETALLDELLKGLEVEIPETLIGNEINHLLTQTATRLQSQGIDIKRLFNQDTISGMRERLRPEAVTRIKRTLALAEIAKQESITVEPQAIEERVKELLERYRDQEVDTQKLRGVVEEELLEEKVIRWLQEHSHVELVPEAAIPQAENPTESLSADEEVTSTLEASVLEATVEPEATTNQEETKAAEATTSNAEVLTNE